MGARVLKGVFQNGTSLDEAYIALTDLAVCLTLEAGGFFVQKGVILHARFSEKFVA